MNPSAKVRISICLLQTCLHPVLILSSPRWGTQAIAIKLQADLMCLKLEGLDGLPVPLAGRQVHSTVT